MKDEMEKDSSQNIGCIIMVIGAIIAAIGASLMSGCLSVVRIPFPIHEKYSDEGVCTNRVWEGFLDKVPEYRVYTTVKMRCHITHEMLKPIPEDLKGEKLYNARMTKRWGWIPLTFIWLTVPFDAAIDTAFLPWDLYCRKEAK